MPTTITTFPIEGRNPEDTPVTRNTIGLSDKFVLQNGTNPKVITLIEALQLFAPSINNTPLSYNPTDTGNTANLNEYVIAQNGKKYFIDIFGSATERGVESKGRYASQQDAIDAGLNDGDRYTLNNPNSGLHTSILEVII